MSAPNPGLEGACKLLETPSDRLFEVIASEYAALAESYGPRNVLVLKRHPAGLERVRSALAAVDTASNTASPQLESVPEHASKVLEANDPTRKRLEYEERIELISLVIDGASQAVPAYIERASGHESFARDVGQLLLEATRQQRHLSDLEESADERGDGTDPARESLAFLYAMNDRFHEELEERGYVERADVIPQAVSLLEGDEAFADRIRSEFDAVLALEFEEFRRLDRRYLAALSAEADLVCLGESHASVERTRVEPGRIEDLVGPGLCLKRLESGVGDAGPPHRAITRLLATGRVPDEDDPNSRARTIRTRTAREQLDAVASEIQSLRARHGWSHDAFAVAVPSIERVPDTRRRLREAGLPTATIGTPSLADDPAVTELYAFVRCQCDRRRHGADVVHDRRERRNRTELDIAYERLAARVPEFSPALLEACDDSSVSRALERWIRHTDLKGRVAEGESWVDAREQYAGIRRVLEVARFVEATDLVAPDWAGLRRMIERTIRYDAPYVHTVETAVPTGGVTVCPLSGLKYDRRRVVFVLDLLEEVYPGEQHLTSLFPTAWLRGLSSYPAVTDLTPDTVRETFETAPDRLGDPFSAYHAQRARRRLALASRAATDRLYCCSYERSADGLRRTFERSRYLSTLESTPGIRLESVDPDATATIRSASSGREAILSQPRVATEDVLREASTGGTADLASVEELFEELAVVVDDERIDDDFAEALYSQFEFAAGEVMRRD